MRAGWPSAQYGRVKCPDNPCPENAGQLTRHHVLAPARSLPDAACSSARIQAAAGLPFVSEAHQRGAPVGWMRLPGNPAIAFERADELAGLGGEDGQPSCGRVR